MNNNPSYYSDANKTKLEKDMWLILPDYIIGKVKRADEKQEQFVSKKYGENHTAV